VALSNAGARDTTPYIFLTGHTAAATPWHQLAGCAWLAMGVLMGCWVLKMYQRPAIHYLIDIADV
jgi:hypothetical protein